MVEGKHFNWQHYRNLFEALVKPEVGRGLPSTLCFRDLCFPENLWKCLNNLNFVYIGLWFQFFFLFPFLKDNCSVARLLRQSPSIQLHSNRNFRTSTSLSPVLCYIFGGFTKNTNSKNYSSCLPSHQKQLTEDLVYLKHRITGPVLMTQKCAPMFGTRQGRSLSRPHINTVSSFTFFNKWLFNICVIY